MTDRPDVYVLVLDCARADRIGAFGYERDTTPFIDSLIREGIGFRNAYSSSIWSLPAYASLLTGLFPSMHGVNEAGRRLSPSVPTLPHALRRDGYATACFSNNAWLSPVFGLGSGFDRFDMMWFAAQDSLLDKAGFLANYAGGRLLRDVDKGARRTNKRILDWVDSIGDRPAFAFAAYVEPHTPYRPHAAIVKDLAPAGFSGFEYDAFEEYSWVLTFPDQRPLSERQRWEINLRYDAEMRFIDGQLKSLVDGLRERGRLDNALIVVTADHGEMLGEDGIYGHQFSVGEPLRRVPLVMWAPGLLGAQPISHDTVQTVDLPATIAGLVGAEWAPHDFTSPILNGTAPNPKRTAITEYPEPFMTSINRIYPDADLTAINRGLRAISQDEHKVLEVDGEHCVGFDLSADPDEQSPLPLDSGPAYQRLADELRAFSDAAVRFDPSTTEMPEEVRVHLRALGYIN